MYDLIISLSPEAISARRQLDGIGASSCRLGLLKGKKP